VIRRRGRRRRRRRKEEDFFMYDGAVLRKSIKVDFCFR
jgi:hypothetical protein